MMTIKLNVDFEHGGSIHQRVVSAIRCLYHVAMEATPETPALGGKLVDETGKTVGSYVVEFQ